MELKVNDYQLPEQVGFNFEELKAEISAKLSHYETAIYTEDQIKQAKADRADLNKLKKALNDERIKREKEYLKPFNLFKAQINEIITLIEKPVAAIDAQIKAVDEQKKADKLTAIRGYWNSCEKPFEIDFDTMVLDYKWLNATSSLKSAYGAIDVFLETINKDLATLQNLPEFGFEATEVYKTTLDLGKAIQEGHRLAEIQKRKLEHEAALERQKAEAEQATIKPAEVPVTELPFEEKPTEPLREWISFKALLTTEDALALRDFFNSRKIEFEAI